MEWPPVHDIVDSRSFSPKQVPPANDSRAGPRPGGGCQPRSIPGLSVGASNSLKISPNLALQHTLGFPVTRQSCMALSRQCNGLGGDEIVACVAELER